MSKYTVEVRFLCETYAGYTESQGFQKVDEIIDTAQLKIFGNYPIFDENYRHVLNHNILKHYYTQEIGAETPGLWLLWLNTKLSEIMPYYNQLYKSALIDFNPMYDTDYTETQDVNKVESKDQTSSERKTLEEGSQNSAESTAQSTDKTKSTQDVTDKSTQDTGDLNQYSDTPQGDLTGQELFGKYLTNVRKTSGTTTASSTGKQIGDASSESSSSSNSSSSTSHDLTDNANSTLKHQINNLDKYIKHVIGKTPGTSYSRLLQEFRETFLNIDMQVIEELSDLFMLLW